MSNTDSFIDEVTEEVRRDKLYATLRKYGWIGVVLVVGIVGGAAFNEYSKAKRANAAQAAGDAITAALGASEAAERAEALGAIDAEGGPRLLAEMIRAGELYAAGDAAGAIAALAPFVGDATLDAGYRDLAVLKTAMMGAGEISVDERISMLAGIAAPRAPYRLLAEEQIAVAQVEAGDVDAAIEGLRAIAEDGGASQGLRQRARQMIVALGGDPVASADG
ncbi:tetratricopeptide repeat protein [Celeribacter sp.]|uniref:tetratricopeptide repeat protein n=1 Tax=Celeribacter sp. TaxID=1890673 RepID=UPI003A9515B5